MKLQRIMRQVCGLLRGASADAEMERELAAHLALLEEDLIQRGESTEEAHRLACIRLGGVEQTRMKHRDARGLPLLESLIADLRFGGRQLMKRKVTTAAAVLSLALAMGACLASFRLVDALFLRPLPIAHPERLYLVQYSGLDETGQPDVDDAASYAQLEAMQAAAQGQADVNAVGYVGGADVSWVGKDEQERAIIQPVSGGIFSAFGLRPQFGRLLTAEDDRTSGASPYVVLSYSYWQRRFGGDATVIGRTVHMEGAIYQVVGVGPKGFTGTQPGKLVDLFIPVTMNPLVKSPGAHWLRVFVLTRAGVPVNTLSDRFNAVDHATQLRYVEELKKSLSYYPKNYADKALSQRILLAPAKTGASRLQLDYGKPLLALGALAGMVLLIACVNVANLMAGLATARAREMAVRVSLGAGRSRLIRLMMMESAMVGMAAAALGILFAWWAAPFVLGRLGTSSSPVRLALDANVRVTLFGAALTVVVTILFGLVPALGTARVQPSSVLKGGADQPVRMRWMHAMIGTQVAFCMMVLFAANLFVSSFTGLALKPLGLAPEHIAVMEVTKPDFEPLPAWQARMEQLRAVPGVEQVSMSDIAMLSGGWMTTSIAIDSQGVKRTPVYELHIWPGWLETMRIPLLAGRNLREDDVTPGSVLVNQAFARQFFHGENPVGQWFTEPRYSEPGKAPTFEIVGLIGDAVYSDIHKPVQPTIYHTVRVAVKPTEVAKINGGVFTVRTSAAPETMLEPLRRAAKQMAGLQVLSVSTQTELVRDQLSRERLLATLAGFFAGVALLLAAVGLYGVLHYSVVQRQREIGIRIALGAAAANIARLVTTRVMAIVLLGVSAGLAGGLAALHLIKSLLYGVKGTEPAMLLLPGTVLLLASACAVLPAVLRALRIDPVVMLRSE